ncbi:MAG: nucleoside deaminase [Lentisphaerae bacterium]|nr:nucleoside deaminase [Lentisphaerota bacterium]
MKELTFEQHERYMQETLRLAHLAQEEGEVPNGCVIVDAGQVRRAEAAIIGRAYNQVEKLRDATAHAEMLAITQATEALDDWRLTDTIMYITKEPCAMCAGAIVLARIPLVVYGLPDPQRGGVSVFNLLDHPRLNHRCEVIPGVLEEPCRELFQEFFRDRR